MDQKRVVKGFYTVLLQGCCSSCYTVETKWRARGLSCIQSCIPYFLFSPENPSESQEGSAQVINEPGNAQSKQRSDWTLLLFSHSEQFNSAPPSDRQGQSVLMGRKQRVHY